MPRLIGLPRALEMIYTGDAVNAREADRIGLKVIGMINPADNLELKFDHRMTVPRWDRLASAGHHSEPVCHKLRSCVAWVPQPPIGPSRW